MASKIIKLSIEEQIEKKEESIKELQNQKRQLKKKLNEQERKARKKDMKFNNATPELRVDPETYEVFIDGELADSKPIKKVPLGQLYNLF